VDFKNQKILVTGATGFKGAWLCLWLKILGAKVYGLGLKPEKDNILFTHLKLNINNYKNYFQNIKNFNKTNQIIKEIKPDIIFHMAAQSIVSSSFIDPKNTFETNVLGSVNILESVKLNKVPVLVFITSDKCYENKEWIWSYRENDELGGKDPYSLSKASAEFAFKSYCNNFFANQNIHSGSVRAGNVIGGGDMKKNRIVPDVMKSIINKKNIYIRNPNATRPWQHVLEPLNGYIKLAYYLQNKKLKKNIIPNWNFGPNTENCKNVKFITNKLIKYSKSKIKVIIRSQNNFHESNLLMLNNEKSKQELKWFPKLSIDETLQWTVNWYLNYIKNSNSHAFSIDQIKNFENL
jgi:CDP-glucose 4,6-dehydratase